MRRKIASFSLRTHPHNFPDGSHQTTTSFQRERSTNLARRNEKKLANLKSKSIESKQPRMNMDTLGAFIALIETVMSDHSIAESLSATEMDSELLPQLWHVRNWLIELILAVLALIPALFVWLGIAIHFDRCSASTEKNRKPPDKIKAESSRRNTMWQLLAIFGVAPLANGFVFGADPFIHRLAVESPTFFGSVPLNLCADPYFDSHGYFRRATLHLNPSAIPDSPCGDEAYIELRRLRDYHYQPQRSDVSLTIAHESLASRQVLVSSDHNEMHPLRTSASKSGHEPTTGRSEHKLTESEHELLGRSGHELTGRSEHELPRISEYELLLGRSRSEHELAEISEHELHSVRSEHAEHEPPLAPPDRTYFSVDEPAQVPPDRTVTFSVDKHPRRIEYMITQESSHEPTQKSEHKPTQRSEHGQSHEQLPHEQVLEQQASGASNCIQPCDRVLPSRHSDQCLRGRIMPTIISQALQSLYQNMYLQKDRLSFPKDGQLVYLHWPYNTTKCTHRKPPDKVSEPGVHKFRISALASALGEQKYQQLYLHENQQLSAQKHQLSRQGKVPAQKQLIFRSVDQPCNVSSSSYGASFSIDEPRICNREGVLLNGTVTVTHQSNGNGNSIRPNGFNYFMPARERMHAATVSTASRENQQQFSSAHQARDLSSLSSADVGEQYQYHISFQLSIPICDREGESATLPHLIAVMSIAFEDGKHLDQAASYEQARAQFFSPAIISLLSYSHQASTEIYAEGDIAAYQFQLQHDNGQHALVDQARLLSWIKLDCTIRALSATAANYFETDQQQSLIKFPVQHSLSVASISASIASSDPSIYILCDADGLCCLCAWQMIARSVHAQRSPKKASATSTSVSDGRVPRRFYYYSSASQQLIFLRKLSARFKRRKDSRTSVSEGDCELLHSQISSESISNHKYEINHKSIRRYRSMKSYRFRGSVTKHFVLNISCFLGKRNSRIPIISSE